MGGEGSGRRPSVETMLNQHKAFVETRGPVPTIDLPNLSGVKPEVLRTSPTSPAAVASALTTGSVLFANSSGQIAQDNSNFFWDDSNNRLGIGTMSPDRKLLIKASTATEGPLAIKSSDESSFPFYVQVNSNDGNIYLRNAGNTDTVRLNTNGDSYLNGGNVGIGTTIPQTMLELSGSSAAFRIENANTPELQLRRSDNTGFSVKNNSGQLDFSYSTSGDFSALTQAMTIKNDGKVGIGTSIPGQMLHLSGSSNVFAYHENLAAGLTGAVGAIYGVNGREFSLGMGGPSNGVHPSQFFIRDDTAGADRLIVDTAGNFLMGQSTSTNPSLTLTAISGGLFISGGELHYKGDKGTITRLAVR